MQAGSVTFLQRYNADISVVLQKISHRVIRKLRRLGYLEAGIDVPVATGYDPLLDNEPELARSVAASVWVAHMAFSGLSFGRDQR